MKTGHFFLGGVVGVVLAALFVLAVIMPPAHIGAWVMHPDALGDRVKRGLNPGKRYYELQSGEREAKAKLAEAQAYIDSVQDKLAKAEVAISAQRQADYKLKETVVLAQELRKRAEKAEETARGAKDAIKVEYRYSSLEDGWFSSDSGLYDGAARTAAYSFKSGRNLTLRCFENAAIRRFDLRYSIPVALLSPIAKQLNKKGKITLVVIVDGKPVGEFPTGAIEHDHGISFLVPLDMGALRTIVAARNDIVVMPRQDNEDLDSAIEFGTAGLLEKTKPVLAACASLEVPPKTPPAIPAKKA